MDRTGATNQAFAGKDPRSDDIFAKDSLAVSKLSIQGFVRKPSWIPNLWSKIWDATNFYKLTKQISYV